MDQGPHAVSTVDVYILTGYLGAGKTTLLNRLLSLPGFTGLNTAIIVNEFGPAGIDGALIDSRGRRKIEINRGSIFCACVKGEFIRTLEEIALAGQHQAVLIEATGLADPCDVDDFIRLSRTGDKLVLRGVMCLIDAENFTRTAPYMRTAVRQAEYADALIINKADLCLPGVVDKLSGLLTRMNPDAKQVITSYGVLPDSFIKTLSHVRRSGAPAKLPPAGIVAISLTLKPVITRTDFEAAVKRVLPHLLRLKGFPDFGDGAVTMQYVFETGTESKAPEGAKSGALTVICEGISAASLKSAFAEITARL